MRCCSIMDVSIIYICFVVLCCIVRGPSYDNRGGGGYSEQSWEDPVVLPNSRMVPPPAGRMSDEMMPPSHHQQRPTHAQPVQEGGPPGVKYANDCEIIVTAKAQQ